MRTLVWFRGKDLRVSDHLPLVDAIEAGEVIALFVLDPYFFSELRAAEYPHRMQYLLESLHSLQQNLKKLGGELLLATGHSVDVVPRLAGLWRVDRVAAHRWTEPVGRKRDATVAARLEVPLILYEGETLLPPQATLNKQGTPFMVYTPFARAAREQVAQLAPVRAPPAVPPPPVEIDRHALSPLVPALVELGLSPNPRLVQGGEAAARRRMKDFLASSSAYEGTRDEMGQDGTSRLSADLKFGTLSVREVYDRVRRLPESSSREKYLDQLLWREFAYTCLWHRPELLDEPFRREFARFPWSSEPRLWSAWAEGRTGYPVVDAAARQLIQDGFVHNRARMISASFLAKHLLVHYRLGERHYLKYLTDGDWALNNMGWQWSAGCGVDAQPYFRVFNPVLQGARFDQAGAYVRRFIPELAALPDKYLHSPWKAPSDVLTRAGVRLGHSYPAPIVDHAEARQRFLSLARDHLRRLR